MNLWEAWYLNYEASESIDDDLLNNLSLWSTRLARFFVLGGYAPGQSPLPITPHDALGIIGFLFQDGVDIESLLEMADDYGNDGETQIPVQWLADPQNMARIHTSWAHDLIHNSEGEKYWLNLRSDLGNLPAEEQICWLLDSAEFILEISALLDESDRVRIDTWAKLLYSDKMLQAAEPLLAGRAGALIAEEQQRQRPPLGDGSLVFAIHQLCRADRLDEGTTFIHGPQISEDQALLLADQLSLSQAAEESLVQTLENLYMHLDEDQISSTYLSDTQKWLEGMLYSAQATLARIDLDLERPDSLLPELDARLSQATVLARLNTLLSPEQKATIRQWATGLFEESA